MLNLTELSGFGVGAEYDPYFTSVSLLMHMDGVNGGTTFTDVKGNSVTVYGNTNTSTAQKKFGSTSGYFDGTGDYLSTAAGAMWAGSENFTVEFWAYLSSVASAKFFIGDVNGAASAVYISGTQIGVMKSGGGYFLGLANTSELPLNQWIHIAITRSGDVHRCFIDGTISTVGAQSTSAGYSWGTATDTWIGAQSGGVYAITGYLDDIRVTRGIARYTANFTAPSSPFPDQ